MCKKNFILISIGFCVIALQSYRETLKKYRKRAITLEKNNFQQFSVEILPLTCLIMCKKNFIPISFSFCVITFQIHKEILKKYRKRAITLEKHFFQHLRKPFLDSHMRNVVPKFQSATLNGVATIAIT